MKLYEVEFKVIKNVLANSKEEAELKILETHNSTGIVSTNILNGVYYTVFDDEVFLKDIDEQRLIENVSNAIEFDYLGYWAEYPSSEYTQEKAAEYIEEIEWKLSQSTEETNK